MAALIFGAMAGAERGLTEARSRMSERERAVLDIVGVVVLLVLLWA